LPTEHKLLQNPGALCNMVRRMAVDAGEIVLKYFDLVDDNHIEAKADGSPVSLADREAEVFIQLSLGQLIPGIPVIGEEAAELGKLPDLEMAEYFWLVDALDGTKEFLSGGEDFTVNIALIHKGEPILGVVYAPAVGILYAGYGPNTALRWNQDNDKEKSIRVRRTPKEGLTVVASQRHGDGGKLEKFLEEFKVKKILKRGSSLKICSIAEGKADIYPRFGPTCEWDTAAGDAVLRSAGGFLTDLEGKPLAYGNADKEFLNPEFIACSFAWYEKDAA
jgi:3'(2'), 5'-bisphosphate nucleotidase